MRFKDPILLRYYVLAYVLFVPPNVAGNQKWRNIKPSVSNRIQHRAVIKFLNRLIPQHAHYFIVAIDSDFSGNSSLDAVTMESFPNNNATYIRLMANTGVSATWGLHYYLKYYCKSHISWDSVRIDIPKILPTVNLTLTSQEKFKYWGNVCTSGYSYAFWNWNQWEKHIDWMALNGINLPLAFSGQEAIWKRVYNKLGLNTTTLAPYFSGPAFFPWQRMGNLNGWGGPIHEKFLQRQLHLQHKILKRMRSLGMTPVIPAFAGHVPSALQKVFPHSTFSKLKPWNSFNSTLLLEFSDPLFEDIGALFIKLYCDEFGTDHVYNCDAFNEMIPKSNKPSYIAKSASKIYDTMNRVDPDAVWIMQGWLFLNSFWTSELCRALLTAVPMGSMIILDLDSTYLEQYTRTEGYYGQPFIFNNLNNYGGSLGLWGRSEVINTRIFEVRQRYRANLVGIGFTPEGLTDTYAPTELMSEMSWRTAPISELHQWFVDYSVRRYGSLEVCASKAWRKLAQTVYKANGKHFNRKILIVAPPEFGMKNYAWYSFSDLLYAWDSMMTCIDKGFYKKRSYRFDLINLTRQVLADAAPYWYYNAMRSFSNNNTNKIMDNSIKFMDILLDLDSLLNTDERFMFGSHIKAVRKAGYTKEESDLYEFNLRNQVTLWGPRGQILDYANKQWGGLISGYYIPRWMLFFSQLEADANLGRPFQAIQFYETFYNTLGIPFSKSKRKFPEDAQGDSIIEIRRIYNKWRVSTFDKHFIRIVDSHKISELQLDLQLFETKV